MENKRLSIGGVLSLALVLGFGIAWGAENPSRDAGHFHTIAVIDPGLLFPEALTIGRGEEIEFVNHSAEAINLVFIDPRDSADEVHCRAAGNKAATTAATETTMERPTLAGGPRRLLALTIPPGRYTTSCSLTPGRYAFVTERVGRDPRSPLDVLGQKGTISVE